MSEVEAPGACWADENAAAVERRYGRLEYRSSCDEESWDTEGTGLGHEERCAAIGRGHETTQHLNDANRERARAAAHWAGSNGQRTAVALLPSKGRTMRIDQRCCTAWQERSLERGAWLDDPHGERDRGESNIRTITSFAVLNLCFAVWKRSVIRSSNPAGCGGLVSRLCST